MKSYTCGEENTSKFFDIPCIEYCAKDFICIILNSMSIYEMRKLNFRDVK